MRRVIADWPGVAPEELALLSPAMAGLPSGSASALALLPTHDANRDLFRVIEGHEAAPAELCAGVFAADPFLGLAEAFRRFVRAGIGRVANNDGIGSRRRTGIDHPVGVVGFQAIGKGIAPIGGGLRPYSADIRLVVSVEKHYRTA